MRRNSPKPDSNTALLGANLKNATGYLVKLGMTASVSVIWESKESMNHLYELENELKMEKLLI